MPVAGNNFLLHWTNTSDKPDITLLPGTQDTVTTALSLTGQGIGDWGEAQQQNLLRLLEHFSNATAPSPATKGQLWWKSDTNELKVYTGAAWEAISRAVIASSPTAPADTTNGNLWYETDTNWLWVWNGTSWSKIYSTNNLPSASAPTSPANGQLWLDTVLNQLKAWNESTASWYIIGPVTFTQSFTALQVSLPTIVDNVVTVGNWDGSNGAHNVVIGITATGTNVSISKCYELTTSWHATAGAWKLVQPTYASPPINGHDFDLEIRQTNAVLDLRLRRKAGTEASTANIYMQNIGYATDVWTAVTPTISAEAAVTTFITINKNVLGTGTPSSANFLRGDGTWAAPPQQTQNLINTTTYFMAGW